MVKYVIDIMNNKYFINNKKSNAVTIWCEVLIIALLIFLNICFNYDYKIYDEYLGYVKSFDSNFKLVLYVLEEDVSSIYKSSLLVEDNNYSFSIYNISHEYYVIDNNKYYEVVLNVELDRNLLIENNIVNVVFEKGNTTLYKEFKKGLVKWLN